MFSRSTSSLLRCTFSRLHKYCETRWVERHEAVILFSEALPDIVESLEVLMESETGRNATASALHTRLCSFNFLVSLAVSERFLSLTLRLSQYLQGNFVDMSAALEHIDLVLKQLSDIRKNANDQFKEIFDSCEATARGFGVQPEIPRKIGSQKYRENHASSSPEKYYRRTCFIPYLDDLQTALNERFTAHRATLKSLEFVLPNYTAESSFESLQPAVEFYMADMEPKNLRVIKAEGEIWKQATPSEELPRYATEAMKQCNTSLFLNISTLLRILATLPVTTAAAEGSFSTLKRLKTYLRNSSVEERLNGLALMSLYRESVDVSNVIATFTMKARRLVF
ncbi:hypothetical protein HPB48_014545 [Haemaphysalis longicornis]|uniref:HAT C-terminal dimerisation domain-containing protein n=1 Tax=Haemaphysalis longicornis TaxID=44386 RepID=A0A9J6GY33_HAELO|nr:hypothetical protein HPB48_014545 [Haemaphysalis longicornis]